MQVLSSGKSQRTISSALAHQNSQANNYVKSAAMQQREAPPQNPLTREMIAQKQNIKTENLGTIKNINLWGFEIDNLALLREMPALEILSLSQNRVHTLRDLAHCQKAQEIYIRKNLICDLQEVAHLAHLPNLRVLWLSHNPCADHPYYRPYIVKKLQHLVKLDNAEVKKEERVAANRLNFDLIFKETPSVV